MSDVPPAPRLPTLPIPEVTTPAPVPVITDSPSLTGGVFPSGLADVLATVEPLTSGAGTVPAVVAGTITVGPGSAPSALSLTPALASMTGLHQHPDTQMSMTGLLDVTSGLGQGRLSGTTKLSIPFFFGVLALMVLAVQMRVGRGDPKLVEAPTDPDDRGVPFI